MAAKKNNQSNTSPKDFKHYTKLLEIFLYGMELSCFFSFALGNFRSMPSLKI
jgi:hypothetical protein